MMGSAVCPFPSSLECRRFGRCCMDNGEMTRTSVSTESCASRQTPMTALRLASGSMAETWDLRRLSFSLGGIVFPSRATTGWCWTTTCPDGEMNCVRPKRAVRN